VRSSESYGKLIVMRRQVARGVSSVTFGGQLKVLFREDVSGLMDAIGKVVVLAGTAKLRRFSTSTALALSA
jgi:pyrroline-5-carboxylate reductase